VAIINFPIRFTYNPCGSVAKKIQANRPYHSVVGRMDLMCKRNF